jgi:hypothetical protein
VQLLTETPAPLCELAISQGKGFGLFATSSIARGTRIIEEAPLAVIPPHNRGAEMNFSHLVRALRDMTPEQRDTFFGLYHERITEPTPVEYAKFAQDNVDVTGPASGS